MALQLRMFLINSVNHVKNTKDCDRDKESKVIEHMQNKRPSTDQQKLSPLKIASYAGFIVAAIALVCALALLLFPDPLVNRFIKPRITKAFAGAYPAYSIRIAGMNYSVLKNRFEFDSVALSAADGAFSSNMGRFSVSGIGWIRLLGGGKLGPKDFTNADLHAQDIELTFPHSRYELRCKRLQVSVPDSTVAAESLELHPAAGDEDFFRASKFSRTRLSLVAPQCSVMGLACLELLKGKMYRTRLVQIHDAFLDVLVNKDKPDGKDTSGPFMPNEILSSIKKTLRVDSLSIMNGRLKYGERFAVGSKPAWVTVDNMRVSVKGITNHGGRAAVLAIRAQGDFLKAGTMNVLMSIPIASPGFSFHYSGSLSGMDLSALNSFLETAEQIRIKEGVLEEAKFEIDVVSGRASGDVRCIYKDLVFAAINKQTGSEKGFSDNISSFFANTFRIRGTNVPDKSGSIKIGKVNYTRKPDDPFIRFTWFALRSGMRDVVGF
jgi:hypothetical protein